MSDGSDEYFMREALTLAKNGWGKTSPNPMVGAVIAEDGVVVARGWHKADGLAHAEIECLSALARLPKENAVMYVTLEPCSTHGRTGACTKAIMQAGVKNVVIGALDPNPAHAGRGVQILRAAGVNVKTGVLAQACKDLNFIFNYNMAHAKALLAIKFAQSADGKIGFSEEPRVHITGKIAIADVHRWRALFAAIGVGAGTLIKDDPALTIRREGALDGCAQRIIFSSTLKFAETGLDRAVFKDSFKHKTRVICPFDVPADKLEALSAAGVSVMQTRSVFEDSAAFWDEVKTRLYEEERIASIYIEGGARIFDSLIQSRAADWVFAYQSPQNLGGKALSAMTEESFKMWRIKNPKYEILGSDTLSYGEIEYI